MTTTTRNRLFVGLLLVSLVAGVAASGAVTAQNATDNGTNETMGANASSNISITADPDAAGAVSNHTVNITIGNNSAGDLGGVIVDYNGTNASTTEAPRSVQSVVLGGQDIVDNTTAIARDGRTVELSFDLNDTLGSVEAGDELSMVYGGVENPPEPGQYPVIVRINASNETSNTTASFNVSESQTTTEGVVTPQETTGTETMGAETTQMETTQMETTEEETTTAESTETETATAEPTETETATAEPTETETAEPTEEAGTTTSGDGPGFTAVAALVGVIAATLLAIRRN